MATILKRENAAGWHNVGMTIKASKHKDRTRKMKLSWGDFLFGIAVSVFIGFMLGAIYGWPM